MEELLRKSAKEQSEAIRSKKVSAVELTNASLNRIKNIDDKISLKIAELKETSTTISKESRV